MDVLYTRMCYVNGCVMQMDMLCKWMCGRGARGGGRDAFKTRAPTPWSGEKKPLQQLGLQAHWLG